MARRRGRGRRRRCASRRSPRRRPQTVAAAAPGRRASSRSTSSRSRHHRRADRAGRRRRLLGRVPHRRPARARHARPRTPDSTGRSRRTTFPRCATHVARGAVSGDVDIWLDPALDWAYLERLCSSAGVPVVVKGVLEPEDAARAAECGAAGVVVSNHGGRQLDGAAGDARGAAGRRRRRRRPGRGAPRRRHPARHDVVVAARSAPGRCSPAARRSGGSRRGGAEGAATVLELLREELEIALHLTGCRSLDEVDAQRPRYNRRARERRAADPQRRRRPAGRAGSRRS